MEDTETLLGLFVIVIILAIYLIPTFVAISRKKENKTIIILMNVFLGWSIICWLLALLWAVSDDEKPTQIIVKERKTKNEVNNFDQLIKLKELLDKEIITKEEFEIQKEKLLK